MIVTIDGPAGAGKSTMARMLAEGIGAAFLDTGAMYRGVTVALLRAEVDLKNEEEMFEVFDKADLKFELVGGEMRVFLCGEDISEEIRSADVESKAKYAAGAKCVRGKLVEMQRAFASRYEKIVTEGRDQGTVAFPDADVKIYLTASAKERALRRQGQLREKGIEKSVEEIMDAIVSRDDSDSSRAVGPLKAADDAVVVDSSGLSIEEAVNELVRIVEAKCENE